MIDIVVRRNEGVVLVQPSGPLKQSDFESLAGEIDSFSGGEDRLTGLIIHTKTFPGWDDFSAFLQHMKFVKDHHTQIRRVAIVTDSSLGAIGPGILKHFVSARIKHFKYGDLKKAEGGGRETT